MNGHCLVRSPITQQMAVVSHSLPFPGVMGANSTAESLGGDHSASSQPPSGWAQESLVHTTSIAWELMGVHAWWPKNVVQPAA